jgi:hypothetical protein
MLTDETRHSIDGKVPLLPLSPEQKIIGGTHLQVKRLDLSRRAGVRREQRIGK